MKRLLFGIALLLASTNSMAQTAIGDSLKRLSVEKTDTGKAKLLYMLSYYYQIYKPDSALLLARAAYQISSKAGFEKGLRNSLGQMAGAYNKLGNYAKALETYFEQLKLVEKQNDPEIIANSYLSIALVYSSKKEMPKALFYAYKADSIARTHQLEELYLYTTLDIGNMFIESNLLDSALYYTRLSYEASLFKPTDTTDYQKQSKLRIRGTALNNMGNIFSRQGEYASAIANYHFSIPFLEEQQDYNTLSECYLGLGRAFDNLHRPDSALYYATKSYRLSSDNQFLQHSLNASNFLTLLYKNQNKIDSAFGYQETYMALKDSFDNVQKLKDLQNLTINEELRQEDMAQEKQLQEKERKMKLQLLFIGMLIPVLFFFSAFISRKRVHRRMIELSGIFSLLFLFEYITLLIHPVVAEKSGHSPAIEIMIFVALAALLSPMHHRVEHWLIARLTKKHQHAARHQPQHQPKPL
jgi:tetratricopeptide (TPR) repeat protein